MSDVLLLYLVLLLLLLLNCCTLFCSRWAHVVATSGAAFGEPA
jgi:hypothetical protein